MSNKTNFSNKPTFENFRLQTLVNTNNTTSFFTNYHYKPNFILIDSVSTSRVGSLIFNDILPVYRSTEELVSIINASLDDISRFFWLSKTFLICTFSFLYIIMENAVYQSYLILSELYYHVSIFPEYCKSLKSRVNDILAIFNSTQARELWWLELKIDLTTVLSSANDLIQTVWQVARKFYLAVLVFIILGLLTFSSVPKNSSNKPSSFLSKFLQNYSLNKSAVNNLSFAESSIVSISGSNNAEISVDTISEYTTTKEDTLESISQLFGLKIETIAVNNKISGDTFNSDQKLYIPFTDGYIINLDKDTSATELSNITGVPANLIINQNLNLSSLSKEIFKKDSLLLIPTNEPAKIENLIKANQTAVQIATQAKQKQQQIAKVAIPVSINPDIKVISSEQAKSYGFKRPVNWQYVSRCFSPGHNGCDLVAPLGSPLYAVQKGVVVKVMNFDISGYGKAVVIDHGNGLSSLYAHLSKIEVSLGDILTQGQKIGEVGDTGNATGYHCHFEIKFNGNRIDPWPFIGQ